MAAKINNSFFSVILIIIQVEVEKLEWEAELMERCCQCGCRPLLVLVTNRHVACFILNSSLLHKHGVNGRNHLAACCSRDLDLFGEVTNNPLHSNTDSYDFTGILVSHFSLVVLPPVPKIKFDSNITIICNIFTKYWCKKAPLWVWEWVSEGQRLCWGFLGLQTHG